MLLTCINKIKEIISNPKFYAKILLSLIIIVSSIMLFWNSIIDSYDIQYHLTRIDQIAKCIKNGDILALTGPDIHGYANGLFYPQLLLYIPAIFIVIGFNLLTSYKIFLFIINICTTLIMYFGTKSVTNNSKTGIISAVLYSTCTYTLTVKYTFSSLGSAQAVMFLPLVILGLYEILYRNSNKWYILTIGILGLASSHLISLFLTIVFICLPLVIMNIKNLINDIARLKHLIYATIITLLLSACFILPFLEQVLNYNFVLTEQTPNIDIQKSVSKFPLNIIGVHYTEDRPSSVYYRDTIGVGLILTVCSAIFIFIKRKINLISDEAKKYFSLLYILAIVYIIIIVIKPLWQYLALLNFIQFVWRFQLINSVIFCMISSIVLEYLIVTKKKYKDFLVLLIFVVMTFNLLYLNYKYVGQKQKYIGKSAIKYSLGCGAEYVPSNIDIEKINTTSSTNNKDLIYSINQEGTKYIITHSNNLKSDTYIQLPVFYYKGYEIIKNTNRKNNIQDSDNGYLKIYIADKEGKLAIKYTGTKLLKLGYLITLITLTLCILKTKYYKNIAKI